MSTTERVTQKGHVVLGFLNVEDLKQSSHLKKPTINSVSKRFYQLEGQSEHGVRFSAVDWAGNLLPCAGESLLVCCKIFTSQGDERVDK